MAKRGRRPTLVVLKIKEEVELTKHQLLKLHKKKVDLAELCRSAVMAKLRGPMPGKRTA